MEKLTPQLSKLIVLQLTKMSLERIDFYKTDDTLSDHEKRLMQIAVDNQLVDINSQIKYQEKICGR